MTRPLKRRLLATIALCSALASLGCTPTGDAGGLADLGALLDQVLAPRPDDNGGLRPDGVSDDPAGDDSAGRPDGASDDAPGDDKGGDRPDGVSDDAPPTDPGGSRDDNVSDDPSDDAPAPADDLRIETALAGDGTASGSAVYRVEAGRRKFKVEVEDAPAGIYPIRINGVAVAELTIGELGFGEVEFDSKPEPGHVPFPDAFPQAIRAGDVVEVGALVSGVF